MLAVVALAGVAAAGLLAGAVVGAPKPDARSAAAVHAPVGSDTYKLPRQFSSQRGKEGWYYLYGGGASGPTRAVWDNTIAPWGAMAWSSWNGSPRYLYIGGRADDPDRRALRRLDRVEGAEGRHRPDRRDAERR